MNGRTLSLVAGLAVLMAMIAPAGAEAQPLVTNSFEETSAELEAVSENMILATPLGSLACSTVRLEVELSENTTETAFGQAAGIASGSPKLATHEGPCDGLVLGPTNPMTLRFVYIDLHAGGVGVAWVEMTVDIPLISGPYTCHYEGPATLSYEEGSDEFSSEITLANVESSPPCIVSSSIAADFTLTELGEPVTIG